MTLIPVPTATAAASAAAPTQIAIQTTNNSTNEVIYTVPAGRKFTGHFWSNTTSTGNVKINGVVTNFPGQNYNITPVSLVAGTILIKADTTYLWIIGVEEDA
jgi:uncharacterized protein YegJ (DUF2314 family)